MQFANFFFFSLPNICLDFWMASRCQPMLVRVRHAGQQPPNFPCTTFMVVQCLLEGRDGLIDPEFVSGGVSAL